MSNIGELTIDEIYAVAASFNEGFIAQQRVIDAMGYKRPIIIALAEKKNFAYYCQMVKVDPKQIVEKIHRLSDQEVQDLAKDIYAHWNACCLIADYNLRGKNGRKRRPLNSQE